MVTEVQTQNSAQNFTGHVNQISHFISRTRKGIKFNQEKKNRQRRMTIQTEQLSVIHLFGASCISETRKMAKERFMQSERKLHVTTSFILGEASLRRTVSSISGK